MSIDPDPPESDISLYLDEDWTNILVKNLQRETTRTQKCRLISSVERIHFKDDNWANLWQKVIFRGENAELFGKKNVKIGSFEITAFQRMLLDSNPDLYGRSLGRSEIKEELGEWNLCFDIKTRIIAEGGEAIVFSEKFGDLEMAVRVHVFDSFLFTDNANTITWKLHYSKGNIFRFLL